MNKDKLKDYFYSNIATIFWSSFLLLGGAIFVAYYAHIEYMPEFDLKSSIAITAAVAVTALISTIILLVVMVLPGSFWGNTWGKDSKLRKYWTDDDNIETISGLLIWFGIPLALIYATATASYFISWYSLFIILSGILAFYFYIKVKLSHENALGEVLKQYLVALIASIFIVIPLFFIISLSIQTEHNLKISSWAAGLIAGTFIIIVNVFAATTAKNIKPFYWRLGLGAVTLGFVLVFFDNTHRIPVKVMELYKFGNIKADEMVLKKDSCNVFQAFKIEIKNNEEEYCVVRNIVILSRLGPETYLKYSEKDSIMKFTVKTSDILSWSVKTENTTFNRTINSPL